MIIKYIDQLIGYGIKNRLIEKEDILYIRNSYFDVFDVKDVNSDYVSYKEDMNLENILLNINEYAYKKNLIEKDIPPYSDNFDSYIMGIMVKRPSEVIKDFKVAYEISPKKALDDFYKFSKNTDYIKTYRIEKDIAYKVDSKYGQMDITINLSKPEKDPDSIAKASKIIHNNYPKCLLCPENEGFKGNINHPGRKNHRIIPLKINGEEWGFQYSPYVYYNEHCILFNKKHIPMKIDETIFDKLFDFVEQFPHYFIGSNADIPIVGGSILSHEHFQGGNYKFPMFNAAIEKEYIIKGNENVKCEILNWPLSVIKLSSKKLKDVKNLGLHILDKWKKYEDIEGQIINNTEGICHNAITPVALKENDDYILYLALRNNFTTNEHPLGLYHPHKEYHNIKKENIGLIEVMGLAVLPSRLKAEMDKIKYAVTNNIDIKNNEILGIHNEWLEKIKLKRKDINEKNLTNILYEEIGNTFVNVLEDAGVYKCTKNGRIYFEKFINSL